MTTATAARFERRDHGRNHSYWLGGYKMPGVTTVLDYAIGKPALVGWAANTTAEYAVDHWDDLEQEPLTRRLATLKRARWEVSDRAKLTGTRVHKYAEGLVAGLEIDVPDEYLGAVQALARLIDRWGMEPVAAERPVWHPRHWWAGTFDLLCGINGTLWLLDWKTGKGVYAETALQLAAYAHAERFLRADGTEGAWTQPERCGAVHITADSAELHEVDAGDQAYETFRHAKRVAAWLVDADSAREEGRAWPIGPALDVEEVLSA